ncbi:MAG: DUF1311 domain-containing protein [Campylobacterota bacterium]|nr:DUF1311 domain-containing protein [Campylobacterota bacterium]
MKIKIISILLASATLLPANPNYSKTFNQCIDRSGGVTFKMSQCTAAEIKHHDKLLNTNYKKTMKVLSKEKFPLTF